MFNMKALGIYVKYYISDISNIILCTQDIPLQGNPIWQEEEKVTLIFAYLYKIETETEPRPDRQKKVCTLHSSSCKACIFCCFNFFVHWNVYYHTSVLISKYSHLHCMYDHSNISFLPHILFTKDSHILLNKEIYSSSLHCKQNVRKKRNVVMIFSLFWCITICFRIHIIHIVY